MQPLEKLLRNRLEKTIKDARDIAESAAHAALEQLGVGEAAPFAHLSEPERDLRRKLRVHGRQLGDLRDVARETQSLDRLVEEIAYEHWHRMLFARFLAENNLLMYPDPEDPVAVTLEECEDLAADEGAANGWELAARYAARMLPQIFRLDSPAFQLTLPPEHQQKLEQLIAALPFAVFTAADSLGWVYQFWQAKKKDDVNASEVKIGARELPAVTQLFTEPYMVSFLLDNSLGAWWAARRLSEKDFEEVATKYTENAEIERELRRRASIPGVPLEYLRFVTKEPRIETDGDGLDTEKENIRVHPGSSVVKKWVPAAGTFAGWPDNLAELKTLDPCCGSGHFLVAAFLMLVPMRIERENLTAQAAVDAVLRENIHGLELDQRCVELAAFALALTAWKYPGAGGYRVLPELNVACSGLSVSLAREEWRQLGLGKKNLAIALGWLHDTFKDAPVLGSLLNPAKTDASRLVEWEELSDSLEQALKQEQTDEQQEIGVVALGLTQAATMLADKYHLVVTNVPYLGRKYHCDELKVFCEKKYPYGKSDLATVFLNRCLDLCYIGGTASVVLTQNWMFLSSYRKFREQLLVNEKWNFISLLGGGAEAFHKGPGNITNISMVSITKSDSYVCGFFDKHSAIQIISAIDVTALKSVSLKSNGLISNEVIRLEQKLQLGNPDYRITLEKTGSFNLLREKANTGTGVQTFDSPRFFNNFWEYSQYSAPYIPCQSTVKNSEDFAGRSLLLNWGGDNGDLAKMMAEKERLENYSSGVWKAWERYQYSEGVCVSLMGKLPATLFGGNSFDINTGVIIPQNNDDLPAIWSLCKSNDFNYIVRQIDQKLNVTNATLGKIPFDLTHWQKVANEQYPHGLPKPYTNDPIQWIFHGHPCGSVVWDEEKKWTVHSSLRTDDSVLQVAVARLLGYRWPTELDADMELADEQREWVNRCEALLPFADEDGIACIPPVRGEAAAADRLLNLLAAAYGDDWSNDIQAQLLKNAGHVGKTLETWLREKFFTQHCKLFKHRPFIWHIWDGLPDGFAALVNYHKLDAKLLETLIYTYLGDWISRQKQDIDNDIDGAKEKLAAAESLKKKLELILLGEAPYDIFVRWKPLEKQSLGWNPDLNDGVRLNIRPFMTGPDIKKRGAGVLRDKPNIKWNKDRGKDVASAPWYHLGPTYNGKEGDRINDHHLSLAEKNVARKTTDEF